MKTLTRAFITAVFGLLFLFGDHAMAQAPKDDGSRAFIKTHVETSPVLAMFATNSNKTRTIIVDVALRPRKRGSTPSPTTSISVGPGQTASLGQLDGLLIKIERTHFSD
jgi:hypothetical protein